MKDIPTQDVVFDDEATRLMGAAFDQACTSLRQNGCFFEVRQSVAKRIIEAAKNGERNPVRLHRLALEPLNIEPPIPIVPVSVGRDPPVPVYASIACNT